MKRNLILMFVLMCAVSMFGVAQATDAQHNDTQQSGEHHHKHGGGMMMDSDAMLNHLDQQLTLTAEQKTKIKTIIENGNQQAKALRENGKDDKANHEAMRQLHENTHAQVRAALTAEQQQKFDAMMKQHGGKHHDHDKDSTTTTTTESPK